MRKLILISLCFLTLQSFSQTRTKQEIIDWISSKISKYLDSKIYGDEVDKVTYQGEQLFITAHGKLGNHTSSTKITVDWNKLSSFAFQSRGMIMLNGVKIEKKVSTYLEQNKTFESTFNSFMPILDFNQEENLEGRFKNALNDLITILQKERKGNNEAY